MNSKEFNTFMGTSGVHAEGPNIPLDNRPDITETWFAQESDTALAFKHQ